MQIRLIGTKEECLDIVRVFEELKLTDVVGISRGYTNYDKSLRVYLTVKLNPNSLCCTSSSSCDTTVLSCDTTVSNKK